MLSPCITSAQHFPCFVRLSIAPCAEFENYPKAKTARIHCNGRLCIFFALTFVDSIKLLKSRALYRRPPVHFVAENAASALLAPVAHPCIRHHHHHLSLERSAAAFAVITELKQSQSSEGGGQCGKKSNGMNLSPCVCVSVRRRRQSQ